jgi:hypothetical protein
MYGAAFFFIFKVKQTSLIMKITLETLYNGKPYKNIDDAILDATIDGVTDSLKEGIDPFLAELEAEGGTVTINITGDSIETINGELQFNNVSDGLRERILSAL